MLNIAESEIHIWLTHADKITDPTLIESYHAILSTDELVKKNKFLLKSDQHRYLVTRAMVRLILSEYLSNIAPNEWVFSKNEYGKPYIDNRDLPINLYFSISHTDHLIGLAISKNPVIGIDIENINRQTHMMDIAQKYFSNSEIEMLQVIRPELRNKYFFKLWTLKEAYIKARGRGLSLPLNQFSFSFLEKNTIAFSFDANFAEKAKHWQFSLYPLEDEHLLALAVKLWSANQNYDVSLKYITPGQLL